MVGKRKAPEPSKDSENALDGDLFPRGRAEGSVPRVKTKAGKVLFGGDVTAAREKKRRTSDGKAAKNPKASTAGVAALGLSSKRIAIGMTLLGVVTECSEKGVEISLPAGTRAVADPFELLAEDSQAQSRVRAAPFPRSASDDAPSDGDDMSMSSDGEEDDQGSVRPLWQVVRPFDLVRVAVVSAEKTQTGSWKVVVSCRPGLINVNLSALGSTVSGSKADSTLRKHDVVWGAVRNVEDHGYVVSFGPVVTTVGFLAFDEVDDGVSLVAGSPVTVAVLEPQRSGKLTRKVVKVTAKRSIVNSTRVEYSPDMTYTALRAGMLVKARVVRYEPGGGANLNVFGVFAVAVDPAHVPHKAAPKEGTVVEARLLYVDAGTKRVGASLIPSLVQNQKPRQIPDSMTIGRVLQRVVVKRVDVGHGLVLEEAENEDNMNEAPLNDHVSLFAHVSKAFEDRGKKLDDAYQAGMVVDTGARVVSFAHFDGVVNVDMRSSVLSRKALSVGEVVPGDVYECRVVSHSAAGTLIMAVEGDSRVRGVVPFSQISDAAISVRRLAGHSRYKTGSTITCRCLSVDLEHNKVVLTARKSLVGSKLPLLCSLEQASDALSKVQDPGCDDMSPAIFDAVIVGITDGLGLLVAFAGALVGLVPSADLRAVLTPEPTSAAASDPSLPSSTAFSKEYIEGLYPVGRTVQVRLTNVDVNTGKIKASLRLSGKTATIPRRPTLPEGCLVPCRLTSVDEQGKVFTARVRLEDVDEKFAAHVPESQRDQSLECDLPFAHISDFPKLAQRIAEEFQKSVSASTSPPEVGAAMVLDSSKARPVLTLKPSLLGAQASGSLPASFDDIQGLRKLHGAMEKDAEPAPGAPSVGSAPQSRLLRGYVRATLPSGVIVGFLGSLAGFVKKSKVADRFVADPTKAVEPHQSVAVIIDEVDEARKRFSLSMREADIGVDGVIEDSATYFRSFRDVREQFGFPAVEPSFPIGAVVDSILDSSRPYGMVLRLESSTGRKAFGVALEEGPTQSADLKESGDANGEESDSVASAAAATAAEYADRGALSTPPTKGRKAGIPTSSRKTRRQRAAEEKAAVVTTPARVLDVDPFTGVVDVSLDPELVAEAGKRAASSTGKSYSASVLLVKEEYVILAVKGRAHGKSWIAFALRPALGSSSQLAIARGATVKCTGLPAVLDRNLVLADWKCLWSEQESQRSSAIARSSHAAESGSKSDEKAVVSVGDAVAGVVSKAMSLQVNVAIKKGFVGRIHVTNNVRSDADLGTLPLGPADAKLSSRLQLPASGTRLKSLSVLAVRDDGSSAIGDSGEADSNDKTDANPRSETPVVLELSKRECGPSKHLTPASLSVGQKVIGFVKHIQRNPRSRALHAQICLSTSVSVICARVDALTADGDCVLDDAQIGAALVCEVVSTGGSESGQVHVAVSENGRQDPNTRAPFYGVVLSKSEDGVRIELPRHARCDVAKGKRWGFVSICDVNDNFDKIKETLEACTIGSSVMTTFAKHGIESGSADTMWLSMRKSTVEPSEKIEAQDPVVSRSSASSLKNQNVRGVVRSVSKLGCFVSIGCDVTARVLLSDLADEFIKEPEKQFPRGKVVQGKLSNVESAKDGKVQMVLRKRPRSALSGTGGNAAPPPEGALVMGKVSRVERFGALLSLDSGISALLHKSEMKDDGVVSDPSVEFTVGQCVYAVVLDERDAGKLRVGTKRCYFQAAGAADDTADELLYSNMQRLKEWPATAKDAIAAIGDGRHDSNDGDESSASDDPSRQQLMAVDHESDSVADSGADESSDDSAMQMLRSSMSAGAEASDSDSDLETASASSKDAPIREPAPLAVSTGFDFDEPEGQDPSSLDQRAPGISGEEGEEKTQASKKKRDKKRAKDDAERELRAREDAMAEDPNTPQTAEDYERLLLGRPGSHRLWIQYMAFRVTLSQVDKARAVAERALDTIPLERELDRVNVWIAYINLEAAYGASGVATENDRASDTIARERAAAVFRVFDRACKRVTDVVDFHLQVSAALRDSYPEISKEVLKRALRRYRDTPKVWSAMGALQYSVGNVEEARQTLERSLRSLDKRDHVEVSLKFAQMEYRHGSRERGRTSFETLLGNYPKRLDLWNVYLDMETNQFRGASEKGDTDEAEQTLGLVRRIFERCITLDFSTKKMKHLFKRWLEFEIEAGDEQAQDAVKARAREYVETKMVQAPEQ